MYNLASYMGLESWSWSSRQEGMFAKKSISGTADGRTDADFESGNGNRPIRPPAPRPPLPVHSTCLLRDFALQTSSFHSCSVPDRSHEAGLFNLKRSHWSNQSRCPGWNRLIPLIITAFIYKLGQGLKKWNWSCHLLSHSTKWQNELCSKVW